MPDNQDPAIQGNPDPITPVADPATTAPAAAQSFTWKTNLGNDLANSPTIQKFSDTKEGLVDVAKSYLNLEKLLGNEKIPVPKSPDDVAAWTIYKRAFGIPDKPEGYQLADAQTPEGLKGVAFDKNTFASIVHKFNLAPDAAKGLWGAYTEMMSKAYNNAMSSQKEKLTGVVNQMRQEWGDAYQSKVELGQMVINKFADDKESNDFITSALSQDPRGIKFLSKIGDQFSENKIGDFKYQRHSMTPEEAQREMDTIRRDMNHPYNNEKAPRGERDRAIDYMNSLIASTQKARR